MIGFNLLTKKSGLNLALHLFVLQSVKWQSCSETMALLIPPNMPCGRSPPFSAPLLCKDNEASGGVFLCPRYFLSVISLSRSAQLSLGATFWDGVCQTSGKRSGGQSDEFLCACFLCFCSVMILCALYCLWKGATVSNLSSWAGENGEADELK